MSDTFATEWEERLVRSARLDVPRQGARERVLEALLQDRMSTSRPRRAAVAFAVLAAAAVPLAIWLGTRGRADRPLELRPEPPPAASAVVAPNEPRPERAPCAKLVVAPGNDPVIDDFEDKNARLSLIEGREGTWAMYNDGTAPPVNAVNWPWHPARLTPPRGASHYGMHLAGGKMSKWGAVLMVDFAESSCYDVSAYDGIEFWGKGNTRIHVAVTTIDLVPADKGGQCATDCYPAPAKPIDLQKNWNRFTVTWDDIAKLSRPATPFDPARVVTLSFGIYTQDTPFEIWLDDLRFLPKP